MGIAVVNIKLAILGIAMLLVVPHAVIARNNVLGQALMHAVESGNVDKVQILLSRGANPNYKDSDGSTVLGHFCASEGFLARDAASGAKIASILLQAGAHVDERQPYDGCTALLEACIFGQSEAAHVLLKAGANPNVRARSGATALILAVEGQNLRCPDRVGMIKDLLRAKADVNARMNSRIIDGKRVPNTVLAIARRPDYNSTPLQSKIINVLVEAGAK
jgi:ankyrin repeat protein